MRAKQSERIEQLESQLGNISSLLERLVPSTIVQQTVAKAAVPASKLPEVTPVTLCKDGENFVVKVQDQFSFRRSQNGNPLSGSHGWEKVVCPRTGKQYKVNIMIMEA
jgi:hypothetical protein